MPVHVILGPPPNPPVIIFFIMEEVVYSTVLQAVYCTQYAFYAHQIWSPQGHGLSVEYRRGQLTTSLVLGFKFLVLALDCQSLALSLEVVLDIALNIQIFWQPTQHRLSFSRVSRST